MSLILRPYQPTDANVIATWLKSEYLMRQWCADRYERFPVTPENMNSYHQQYIDVLVKHGIVLKWNTRIILQYA